MPLFTSSVPLAPHPKARHSATREEHTIKALGETRGVLARLVSLISSYQPKFVTDVTGRRYEVLARDMGKGPAAQAQELAHPWKIYLQKIDGAWKVGVDNHSDVYDGVTWTKLTVTGLLTDPADPADAGWASPAAEYLFLWGTMNVDGITVDSIEIKNDQDDLADIKRVDSTAGLQTQFAWVIGYLWSTGTGDAIKWHYRQECNRHITMLYVVVNGVLCKVPFEM